MDFKKATDVLFDRVDHDALAKRLGVSVASIRQARLRAEAGAYRSPPVEWEAAVVALAEERMNHYQALIKEVRHLKPAANARAAGQERHTLSSAT